MEDKLYFSHLSESKQKELIENYLRREIQVIKNLNLEELRKAVLAICDAYDRNATIYILGNGGSAATASHFVCDFNKGISSTREKKFNFICLNDNVPMLMAIANDISYDEIFLFPLVNKLKKNDLIIAISGSGNSVNVIKAVEYAKEIGTPIIGITGYDGGRLKQLADFHMDANVDDMQISEDVHMIFDHMMYSVLNSKLLGI